jgi:glucose-6-phosphate 1-epimerase
MSPPEYKELMSIDHVTAGSLPAIRLRAGDGAEATITLFGAHVISWLPAGGKERLFCSTRSAMDGSKAIRGGVPIIFPQFSERGSGMRHGFARLSHWRFLRAGEEAGRSFAEFTLDDTDRTGAPWPYRFSLLFRVSVGHDVLDLSLRVKNTGEESFGFSAALHTYLGVADVSAARIDGLQDTVFHDHTVEPAPVHRQSEARLAIDGVLDRIYYGAPSGLHLHDQAASQHLELQQAGFTDTVIWNPGPMAGLSDLEPGDHQRFICIEPACIETIMLAGSAEWSGSQRVRAMEAR